MNKKYDVLLLDLDDTLLDFKAAERDALARIFSDLQIPDTDENKALYRKINTMLWEDHEKGRIPREQVLNMRFKIFCEELGMTGDGVQLETIYRSYLNQGSQLTDDAMEVVQKLKKNHRLLVASNGVESTQMKRLTASGLLPLMDGIYVSEAVGYHKPQKEFFSHIFSQESITDLSTVMIVGDSLTSDIQGGSNAGIDTCWFNPHHLANGTSLTPTWEIRSLRELLQERGASHC